MKAWTVILSNGDTCYMRGDYYTVEPLANHVLLTFYENRDGSHVKVALFKEWVGVTDVKEDEMYCKVSIQR